MVHKRPLRCAWPNQLFRGASFVNGFRFFPLSKCPSAKIGSQNETYEHSSSHRHGYIAGRRSPPWRLPQPGRPRELDFSAQMNRTFWRPFLIVALAALLLAVAGPFVPAWDNALFPLRKLDLAKTLAGLWNSPAADPRAQAVPDPALPSELKPLRGFWQELAALKNAPGGSLRIAHFGDSIIEGDLISGTLRQLLQGEFGGGGVGLVPITSMVSGFRQTIRHTFSPNWETLSFMSGANKHPLGIMGHTFIPRPYRYEEHVIETQARPELRDSLGNLLSPARQGSSRKESRRLSYRGPAWVEYSGFQTPGAEGSERIRLFYSHASAASRVLVSYDGGEFTSFILSPAEGVRVLDLGPARPVRRVRLQFDPLDPIHLYGVSFDQAAGAYVDNLAIRGFSGMYLDAIPGPYLQSFQSLLGYDLIILQYGGNVSNPQTLDYGWYKRGMLATVRHLQTALPGVPILLVGAHDRGVKVDGRIQTSPDIPLLVEVQSQVARETGCAFWNLFEAMGGPGSMLAWVSSSPPLAGKDYTHFTRAGAVRVGTMLHWLINPGK